MLIPCPHCGPRDSREFTYRGHAVLAERPDDAEWSPVWDAHLHLRENPAGPTRDLWYHEAGCGAWLVVSRDTVTHVVSGAQDVATVKGGGA